MNKNKYFTLVSFIALALLVVFNLTGNVSAATPSVITDAADWVLTQQDPSGLFPWTPGDAGLLKIQSRYDSFREEVMRVYLFLRATGGPRVFRNAVIVDNQTCVRKDCSVGENPSFVAFFRRFPSIFKKIEQSWGNQSPQTPRRLIACFKRTQIE